MIINARPVPEDLSGVVLRPADEAECRAEGMTGAEAIAYSASTSLESWEVSIDGVPVAYWGYGSESLFGPVAQGWLLTTPTVEQYKTKFIRSSVRAVAYILERYPILLVHVHKDYRASCEWLEWLGFCEAQGLRQNDFLAMIKTRRV